MKRQVLLVARYAMLMVAGIVYWLGRFLTGRMKIDRQTKREVWWQIRSRIYAITRNR